MTHKTVDTSLLRIAYDEWNADAPRSVVLLHGWPDSPRCWAAVAPALAQQGWRVLVPALRGFAPTRFLRADTPRTGQLSALGRDLLEFIDALGLHQPALVGHDWGARAAANACGLRLAARRGEPSGNALGGLRHQQPGPGTEPRASPQLLVPLVHGHAARAAERA